MGVDPSRPAVAATVVLYHQRLDALAPSLAGLAGWDHGPVLVHVNDTSPDDPLLGGLRDALPSAEVTWSSANRGFAGGHNALLERAWALGADAAVVHNPDLVLDPGAVELLSQASGRYDGKALLGPALQLADEATLAPEGRIDTVGIVWTRGGRHLDSGQGRPWPPASDVPAVVAGISGACLFVPRPAYQAVVAVCGELFDEDFVAYREDAELGFRAGLLGIPSVVVPLATGRHGRSLRGTARGASEHIDRLGVRNRFLIAFKYGRHRPGGLVGPLLRDVLVIAGVLVRERSSIPGLRDAWRLRATMRAKGAAVLAAARRSSRSAVRP